MICCTVAVRKNRWVLCGIDEFGRVWVMEKGDSKWELQPEPRP